MIGRRQFLVMGAVGATAGVVAACSKSQPQAAAPPSTDVSLAAGETNIDLGGVKVRTWAYGNQVPAREIRLKKGKRLRAELTNAMPQDVTVHWHGIALVNDMDGVPDLTQVAVPNGQTFKYDFVVPDAGTYWFHSHVGAQLDRGLYGPLIIEDPNEKVDYDDELVLVLDDWIDGTGTNADQVFENLKKTGMKPMAPGGPGVTPTSPLGEDGGDVTYPYFVVNGRVPADPQVVDYRAGQRIRLRVINAGSDTAFRVAVPEYDDEGHPDRRLPGGAGARELGDPWHGRAGGRDRHLERVAAGARRAGGQAGPRTAEHASQQCAERGERRRLRRIGTQGGTPGHRDVVTDAGGDAGGQGAGSGDRCPPDRSRQRVHLAG